jgi:hypothetical protein
MSYLHLRQEPTLGYFGCGPGCRCPRCREMEDNPFVGEASASTRPAGPVFRFECRPGCDPVAAAQCQNVLRRAILDAINLASNAASKLEALKRPGARSPDDSRTMRLFRFFFGHDPSRPVPWAGGRESGAIVAHRLRKVAEALRGRGTRYRCIAGCPAGDNARTNAATDPNLVRLCPRFWTLSRSLRAGVLLHEMRHLLYYDFFHHEGHPSGDPERRRDNAHCYEAFALRVARRLVDPSDVTRCRTRPA